MADPTAATNGNAELIEFLQGHFTRIDEQFAEVRGEVRDGLKRVNERIDGLYTLIDSFVKLHQKLDIELVALRDKYNRLSKAHNELASEHHQLIARVARLEGAPA